MIAAATAAALMAASCGCAPAAGTSNGEAGGFALEVAGLERAEVVRVVDGDTVAVRTDDGSERKVRLLGIDAPESASPDEPLNCEEGEAASAHLKESLPQGTPLWLSRDESDEDAYGRLLRFAWIEPPEGGAVSSAEFCAKCLNARLVIEGWAQPKRYPPDTAAADLLDVLGASAAAQGLGVSGKWSEASE